MNLRTGEIVLIEVQFHQTLGAKVRPAVVVLDSGDADFVAAPITSRVRASEFDVTLGDWRGAGLNVPSVVRIDKVAVLAKADIRRLAGMITGDDLASIRKALCRAFCPNHH